MNNTRQLYNEWLQFPDLSDELRADLTSVQNDDNEIFERFYKSLEFGTAGLRGVLGAGINRMNVYTIGIAAQGYANFLKSKYESPTVAIGYDSRKNSDVFSELSAKIFAANGIKSYLYPKLIPTPLVSYAIRRFSCDGGIVVTASHNPAKYNGYKVYGSDGCQIGPDIADVVLDEIAKLSFDDIIKMPLQEALDKKLVEYISNDVVEEFYNLALNERIFPDAIDKTSLKIVYTPLNGTGNVPVRELLKRAGYNDISVVPEQEMPDSTFKTCAYPNPEFKEALALGLDLSRKISADLLIATDPDADRIGIAVREGEDYALLSGNEVGVMMLEYICRGKIEKGTFPDEPVAVKTIVSTPLTEKICEKYNIDLKDVLTGFKFIGNEITKLEKLGKQKNYLLGYEESYGYLKGIYVRDKDAVTAALLIAEMAAYYKMKGKSLADVRKDMYQEYGYYLNNTENYAFEGASGMDKMAAIMDFIRKDKLSGVKDFKLTSFADYFEQYSLDIKSGVKTPIDLPPSNVLSFTYENGFKLIVRPSGTEPKIKLYYTTCGATYNESQNFYINASTIMKAYIFK